jgi:hypothetical protein
MWALLGLQAPLITISQDSGPVSARKTNDGGLTIHRNSNCDGPGLEWAKSASLATGETLTICFTPKSSAYIYIVNESAEGTYMAYPQSADQLGPIATRQTYAFDIVGEPGPETFTFFITQNPIAHFDDAIRRSRLQLSRSRLLHGDGSEAAGSHTNILGTIHAKPLRELAQSNTGSAWLIDLEDLDVVVRCLLDVPGSPRNLLSIRERVRLNSDLSNITQVRSQSDDNDVSPSPRGTAMILEFSYDHRSQR